MTEFFVFQRLSARPAQFAISNNFFAMPQPSSGCQESQKNRARINSVLARPVPNCFLIPRPQAAASGVCSWFHLLQSGSASLSGFPSSSLWLGCRTELYQMRNGTRWTLTHSTIEKGGELLCNACERGTSRTNPLQTSRRRTRQILATQVDLEQLDFEHAGGFRAEITNLGQ
jgi:hypothetical protein